MATELLLILPILVLSVILHEYAHARVAVAQGDRTPAAAGRVTLNPIPHFDPLGSLLVPVGLWVASGGTALFGWARPVPVNPANYEDRQRGDLLVSSAGVVTNFLLAAFFVVWVIACVHMERAAPAFADVIGAARRTGEFGILINLLLGVFNLVPIPPLDGSHLFYYLLPRRFRDRYQSWGRYGMLLLLAILFVPGAFDVVLWPVWRLYELAGLLIRWGV